MEVNRYHGLKCRIKNRPNDINGLLAMLDASKPTSMSKTFIKVLYAFAVITFFLVSALPAGAQGYLVNTIVETGGLYSALTKDASGNIYAIRVTSGGDGTSGEVVKYTGNTATVIYSGLHEGDDTGPGGDLPWGLAVASNGNVYVSTDFAASSGTIIKLAYSGGVYTPTTFQSGAYYTALAVDASDNLYATQYDGATHYAIYKYAANCVDGTPGVMLYDNLKQGVGYSYPTGLAVAANGDIFVTDAFAQTNALPTDGGHVYRLTASSNYATAVTVSTGLYATALALDPAGNLYTSENTANTTSGYKILKYTNGTGAPATLYMPYHTNGIYYPYGIAAISANNIYAIDGDDGTNGGSLNNLAPSTNALLTTIKLNPVSTLTTVIGADYMDYAATVPNAQTSVKVVPTVADPNATIKVNGAIVASGANSAAIPLVVGINVINTVVTAQDGITTKTYSIAVTRTSPQNANLANFTVSVGTLTPVFAGNTVNYTDAVPNTTTQMTVVPTASDASATVTVNGVAVASGSPSGYLNLNVGDNVITTVVTAPNGTTMKTYTLTVNRAPSNNALLSTIKTSPVFPLTVVIGADYKDYTATAPNAQTSVKIVPTVADPTATVTVNGVAVASGTQSPSIPLAVGPNVITTIVTAQDGVTTKTYGITIIRTSTQNANLANFTVSKGTLTPVFNGNTTTYTATVTNGTTQVSVTPTASDPYQGITVNGVENSSGSPSGFIALNVGPNVITTVVTAQDGVTKKTYKLTVTRVSNNAVLSLLKLSPVSTLTEVVGPNYKDYTTTVPVTEATVKVIPTSQDMNATIKVNGMTVASGAASGDIPLNIGINVINTVVTAQDGITVKTYRVTITRQPSTDATLATLNFTPAISKTTVSGPDYRDYVATVANTFTSIAVIPVVHEANATVKVNGMPVASGATSAAISLNVGVNVINTVITAQDNVTTKTYSLSITRNAPGMVMKYDPQEQPATANSLAVHQNVSPNGDGRGDVLVIEGIAAHPDNKLQIMSRNGSLVYEVKGYNNATKAFDGHSSTNGRLQQPGTYLYTLEYKDGNQVKRQTGFVVLKY